MNDFGKGCKHKEEIFQNDLKEQVAKQEEENCKECDYKNAVRHGRADWRCPDCGRNLMLELVLMREAEQATPTHPESLNELVRDLTSVAKFPMPKSAVKKRIEALLTSQKQELKERIEGMKKEKGDNNIVCDNESCTASNAYNYALQDIANIIKESKLI